MEKVSHSLLKRSFSSNPNTAFTSHKSVYDDVFGGPSKFGLPTLSPRLEDYSEIFGGFHASRSSSIPLLNLSLLDHDSDLHFDVRSPGFDYAMVFGDFGGSDFTASFEDLVGQSSRGGYDSSDEPWSPAHSGSLSDELDPIAGSDKSHEFSDDNVHETLQSIKQFNASYSKSSQRSMKTVLAATSHVTSFSAVPGYTFSHYESPVSWDGEDENCSLGVIDDINHNEESGERVGEENQYESSSNPSHNSFAAQRNDCDPFEKHVNSTSPRGKPFVTVSDISLRTKPSRLPPPSRPPPRLVTKNGKCDESNSKLKASRSCAFERMADDTAQLFFDVEIDATNTAKVTEDGNNNVKVKRQSAKEPIERKYIRSHSTMQVGEKTDKIVRVSSAIEDEKLPQSIGKETTVLEPVIEDRIESTESSEANSGPLEVQYCNHNAESSAGTVAWDETTGYFEVIEKNISSQAFDIVEDSDTLMQQMNRDVHNHQDKREHDIFKRVEDFQDFKVTKEAHRCVEESNQPQMNKEHYDCGNKQQQKIPNTRLSDQRGSPKTLTRINLACTYGINKIPENFQQLGECQKQEINHSKEVQPESEGNVNEVEAKLQLKGSPERMDVEKGFLDPQITEQNNGKHKQNILREEFQRRLEDVEGANTIREIARERTEAKGTENRSSGVCGKQNENKLEETYELKESDLILDVSGHDKSWDGHLASENDMEAVRLIENEITLREAPNQISNDKEHKLNKRDVCKERNRDASRTGDNFLRSGVAETEAVNKEEDFEIKGYMSLRRDAGSLEQLSGHAEELEPIEKIWLERGVERDLDSDVLIEGDQLKEFEGGYRVDEVIAANVLGKHDDVQMLEATQAAFSSEKNLELKTEPESSTSTYESETGIVDTPAKGRYDESSKNKDELQDKNTHSVRDDTVISPCLPKQVSDSSICSTGMGISCLMRDKISSALQYSHEPVKKMYSDDDGIQKMNSAHFASKRIDIMDNFNSDQVIRESVMTGRKAEDPSSFLKQNDDTLFSKKNASSQWTERKNIIKDNLAAKDQKVEGKIRREAALEDELMRKIEEEREREREREKDRMSVDKAALEARERSYSEARERAERAAVERATTEARKRAMAEARERLEKASMEARLRAERAAVERATAEARQRATEKLMAQKAAYAFHDQVERSIPDRFSASTRTVDTRQSYVSSDLHFQSTGISNGLRYSYSLVHEGAEGESPQRCKARLERCKRTAERAANALAEKNMRDLLAQREREERNRVAEALDVEVKRWSNGKEGNLRALLSTLQYILGPDSGWHPLPLTEVITSVAVKKAYRKATLCVHPDKLQQRGATIQQKYICEKVFDLLKEAWNKFNSEER